MRDRGSPVDRPLPWWVRMSGLKVLHPPTTHPSAMTTSYNTILGTDTANTLIGTTGADSIASKADADYIQGKGGADLIYAGDGDDTILQQSAVSDAFMHGNEGNDLLSYTASLVSSTVRGGRDNDTLSFAKTFSNAVAYGDLGNDSLFFAESVIGSSIQGGSPRIPLRMVMTPFLLLVQLSAIPSCKPMRAMIRCSSRQRRFPMPLSKLVLATTALP